MERALSMAEVNHHHEENGDELQIVLVGPLVFIELEDKLRSTTTLVIASNPESLEAYCDAKEKEYPSLMPTQDRWNGATMELEDGQIQMKSLPPEIRLSCSTDTAKYLVRFRDWAILAICLSTMSQAEIREVLRSNGLPEVVDIQPEDTPGAGTP
jgi:hypothetical protein